MQLNKLKIKNYRSIENAELEFSKGINIIIGNSQTGKSNIQRLLRDWAFNNTGDDFVTVIADKTQIEINGILWEKGKEKSKKINRYVVDGNSYDNVGRNVPEAVTEQTQIIKIDFGGSEPISLNFIDQHSPFFMIFSSKSDNAKILGRIAGIDKIYKCVKLSSQKLKKSKGIIVNCNKLIDEDKEELKKYNYLIDEERILKEINEKISSYKDKENTLTQLEACVIEHEIAVNDLRKIQIRLETFPVYENINLDNLIQKTNKLDCLSETIKQYEEIKTRLISINSNKYIVDSSIIESIEMLEHKIKKINTLEELCKDYDNYRREHNNIILMLEKYEDSIIGLKKELDFTVKDLDICPLTLDIMPDKCKEKIRG